MGTEGKKMCWGTGGCAGLRTWDAELIVGSMLTRRIQILPVPARLLLMKHFTVRGLLSLRAGYTPKGPSDGAQLSSTSSSLGTWAH